MLEQLCEGSEESYRYVYETYSPRLLRLLRRMFRDEELAQDTVQTTFLILFRKVHQFDGRSSLFTWLTRVALREGSRLSELGRRPLPVEQEQPGPPNPEEVSSRNEDLRQVRALIDAYPLVKRQTLLLFELEGFSVDEIAEVLGEPRGTVLSRLSRTRAELRVAIEAARQPGRRGSRS